MEPAAGICGMRKKATKELTIPDQFLETGADTVGVSCPFCMQMMEEGVQSKGANESKQVKDLVELVEESLG